jgi:hypothetical protein
MESEWLLWKVTGCYESLRVYGLSLLIESQWLVCESLVAMLSQWLLLKVTGCYGNQ